MFQTFDTRGGPEQGRKSLPLIREELARLGLDGIFIPHEDEWQNEYLPECAERLAWATGFTGSAGAAIIMTDSAHLFSDGRYTLQVRTQTDPALFEHHNFTAAALAGFLSGQAPGGAAIGYDPRLVSPDVLSRLKAAAGPRQIRLVALDANPIDAVWADQPPPPRARIVAHAEEFAGESSASKRSRLAEAMRADGLDVAVLTSPASLAWLFNIRGGDVTRTPLPLGQALLRADGTAALFVAPEKVSPDLLAHLGQQVSVLPESDFIAALAELSGQTALADPGLSSAGVFEALEAAGAHVRKGMDITTLPRARKNAVEIAGTQRAHVRDGAALVRFLHWFDEEAPKGNLTEIDVCVALEGFRRDTGALRDLSFDSISGAGANGAIVHYRVTEDTNAKVEPGSLFLIDSGAQYLDGTTDVTRTMVVGTPSEEMCDRFTRVLKGHIQLSMIRFPAGTPGPALDALARMALWQGGFDYDHGTGHGVGSYLGVHEGPQRIAKVSNDIALEEGMIVSNEPGYYKTGAYGIRIENLQYVTAATLIPGGERPMHGFETLTLAPIDRRLILKDMLNGSELDWLNTYHARVLAEIGPRVEGEAHDWLVTATAPL
jgi:Xaa-Pro aminopeptidase